MSYPDVSVYQDVYKITAEDELAAIENYLVSMSRWRNIWGEFQPRLPPTDYEPRFTQGVDI